MKPQAQWLSRSSREHHQDWWWILLLGAGLSTGLALYGEHPSYEDAFYYSLNGLRISEGRGLTDRAITYFYSEPTELPTASHDYWMPLSSFLASAGALLHQGYGGTRIPFTILAALTPLLCYVLSGIFLASRRKRLLVSLLALLAGPHNALWTQPSTFMPFLWCGVASLYFSSRMLLRDSLWSVLGAGCFAGLAHLTRVDGFLFLVSSLLVLVRQHTSGRGYSLRARLLAALFLNLGGSLLVMAPWFVRQYTTFGTPLSPAGLQPILIKDFMEMYSYTTSLELPAYLVTYTWHDLLGRLQAACWSLYHLVLMTTYVLLLPFSIAGAREVFRNPSIGFRWQPVMVYAILLVIFHAVVTPLQSWMGSSIHSSIVLWPFLIILAMEGFDRILSWIVLRRPHWDQRRARVVLPLIFVLGCIGKTLEHGLVDLRCSREFAQLGAFRSYLHEDAVVMAWYPYAVAYHTGCSVIIPPAEGWMTARTVIRRFGVQYLLVMDAGPDYWKELLHLQEKRADISLVYQGEMLRLYAVTAGSGD